MSPSRLTGKKYDSKSKDTAPGDTGKQEISRVEPKAKVILKMLREAKGITI